MRIRIKEEETPETPETPEEQPSSETTSSTDGKQFQIVGNLITNTKENPQTDILSAIRSLPGVTIVNSKATQPNISTDNQVRYEAGIDIKIDTHSLKGDVKEGIKNIISKIKEIPGVVEFKVSPKAKETKPY